MSVKKAPAIISAISSDGLPEGHWLLITGELSSAAKAELKKRVTAGEYEPLVRAELLIREKKAVKSWVD